MIRGIGPVYAKKLLRAFGDKVFDVIEAEPDRLREGGRDRSDTSWPHHGRLGPAEGGPRDHGLPA
jgi:5'-3' exonuclease